MKTIRSDLKPGGAGSVPTPAAVDKATPKPT